MRNKTNLLGILNLTSDSFSDGGEFSEFSNAKNHIDEMISDGCRYIDIGAESTKPGFSDIASDIQIARILPVIKYVKSLSKDIRISIDTRSSLVADRCLKSGATMINDVSGTNHDNDMFKIIHNHNAEIILGHLPDEHKENKSINVSDILATLTDYFDQLILEAESYGIDRKKIIIDPSVCFGKSGDDNIKIIKNINYFVEKYKRVCLGVSNKRFSSKLFENIDDNELTIISSAISSFASYSGVEFLRVHDIEANLDAVEVSWKTFTS